MTTHGANTDAHAIDGNIIGFRVTKDFIGFDTAFPFFARLFIFKLRVDIRNQTAR